MFTNSARNITQLSAYWLATDNPLPQVSWYFFLQTSFCSSFYCWQKWVFFLLFVFFILQELISLCHSAADTLREFLFPSSGVVGEPSWTGCNKVNCTTKKGFSSDTENSVTLFRWILVLQHICNVYLKIRKEKHQSMDFSHFTWLSVLFWLSFNVTMATILFNFSNGTHCDFSFIQRSLFQ